MWSRAAKSTGSLQAMGLLFLLLISCYDAPRTNPFDPALTPAVELLGAALNDTSGTLTLTWTPYQGQQPFAAYRVLRRVEELVKVDTLATITEVQQTSYRDTALQPDIDYRYWVEVSNTAGFEVKSSERAVTSFSVGEGGVLAAHADSLSGTVALQWEHYGGPQFARYEVYRRRVGEDAERLTTLTDRTDTSWVDQTPVPGVIYSYWLVLVAAGQQRESRPVEVQYQLPPVELLEAEFSSDTAGAELAWTRYQGPGFAGYEVRRKAPGLDEERVAELGNIDSTAYSDRRLDGNTEYTYHIVVRTLWGGDAAVVSNERSGRFYPFAHSIRLEEIPDAEPRAVALAVDEQDHLYIARTMRETKSSLGSRLMKKGVVVDFPPNIGRKLLFSETRPDPESSVHMVAGQGRVYVSVRSGTGKALIAALSESGQELWPDSVDTEGDAPVGLYLEANGDILMGDDRNLLYRFGPEGDPPEEGGGGLQAVLEPFQIQTAGQMVVGPGVGRDGGDHFFFLAPDQRDYHVLAVTRRLGAEFLFRGGTGIAIDEGIGPEKGQTLNPVALAFDPQRQRLLVLEAHGRLQVFDGRWGAQRRYITQWGRFGTGEGEFLISHPTGATMVVDSQGMIYVADGSGWIQVFAP